MEDMEEGLEVDMVGAMEEDSAVATVEGLKGVMVEDTVVMNRLLLRKSMAVMEVAMEDTNQVMAEEEDLVVDMEDLTVVMEEDMKEDTVVVKPMLKKPDMEGTTQLQLSLYPTPCRRSTLVKAPILRRNTEVPMEGTVVILVVTVVVEGMVEDMVERSSRSKRSRVVVTEAEVVAVMEVGTDMLACLLPKPR